MPREQKATLATVAGSREVSLAGLDVIDAWDVLRAAIEQNGPASVFARDYPGDVHLSALGHERVARWLLEALRDRGVTDTPGQ